jgi:hypothetical protein
MLRNQELRNDKTSFRVIDAQSARNADAAEEKGYDADKKNIRAAYRGRYRRPPHAVYATGAGVTDRNGAVEMIKINRDSLSKVRKFLCDGDYSGENFAGSGKGN